MQSSERWNFYVALLIGTLFGGIAGALYSYFEFFKANDFFAVTPDKQEHLFIYNYQALIGGFVAAFAAACTVFAIFRQIRREDERREEDRKRKLSVYRAYMPDALAELCNITSNYFKFLEKKDYINLIAYLDTISSEHINIFKDSLAFMPSETSKKILIMVQFYQVHRSRLRSINLATVHYKYAERQYDTILLRSYLDKLFEYAREESDNIENMEPNYGEITSAYNQINSRISLDPDLMDIINKKHTD